MRRRGWRLLGWAVVAVAVVGGIVWVAGAVWFQVVLNRAKQELASGHHESARQQLAWLSARWPGWGDVEFHLGLCERARGDLDAAMAAWDRVPRGSAYAVRAAVQQARVLTHRGRFADAEAVLEAILRDAGPRAYEAREVLARLYRLQGRHADTRRLLQDGWDTAPNPVLLLNDLWLFESDPVAVEGVQIVLEQAARLAPEDDRVWLGRANLETSLGRLDEAVPWLDACRRRRPHDPAVWRSHLNWALSAHRLDEAERALSYLPAHHFTTTEILMLHARLAALRGDHQAERRALEAVLDLEPGQTHALDRLADLAVQSGRHEDAVPLRQRQAEIDQWRDRYRKLLADQRGLRREARTLARLAEALGRHFEARGWWTVVARQESGDPEALAALERLERTEGPRHSPGLTLADVVGGLDPGTDRSTPSPRSEVVESPIDFVDDAEAAGLRFVYDDGRSRLHQLPETMGGGVGLLDYDGDGWMDVYVVQGGPFPPDPNRPHDGDRLFRNNGDGTFTDVTEQAGIAAFTQGYGHGVTVGDYDNDGWPDLFITRWRSYALYRNNGDGTFSDVTEAVGLGGDRDWPTSAAFADLDNDGYLDLYVCHYLLWDADHPHLCQKGSRADSYMYCDPSGFYPLPDRLYRNEGGRRFVEVTGPAGIIAPDGHDGRALGVVAADLDGDGLMDLYVANDTTANFLFRNLGDFRFEEIGQLAGVASNAQGGYQASMGIACGDLDGDGRLDLAVTNFYGEGTTFYQNLGGGMFSDRTAAIGLAAPSRYLLGFGIAFVDVNRDGWLDLIAANGHVNDFRPMIPYAMPTQLMLGGEGGRLTDVTERSGSPWRVPRVGRALATGDLDNDGNIDAVLISLGQPLAYFHNRTEGGHFVTLRLEGVTSNRDAVGAQVTLRAGGRTQVAHRIGGGSYQSASDPRLHFGLGDSDQVESIEVRWPSGRVDHYHDLPANTGYLLREGASALTPLVSFAER